VKKHCPYLHPICIALITAFSSAGASQAAVLQWLEMSSYAPGVLNAPVSGSTFTMPGIGNVTLTWSVPSTINLLRLSPSLYPSGSAAGHSWTNLEQFNGHRPTSSPTNDVWTFTYTFDTPVPAGALYFGTLGLGRLDTPGAITTVTGDHNATFLGDYDSPSNFGATDFTGGAGSFTVRNSLSGPGGGTAPNWNSELGLMQITDGGFTTLNLTISGIPGDGYAWNIAAAVPEPSSAVLGIGAVGLLMRRRRSAVQA
jgi:hypothetical protein